MRNKKMKRTNEMNDVKISRRIISGFMLVVYLIGLGPVSLFAQNLNRTISGSPYRENRLPAGERVKSTFVNYVENKTKEEKSEELIIAEKGGSITLGDASIVIPSGALKENKKISITHLKTVEDTGESLFNAIPDFGGYRFLPKGTKFEKDVIVTLPYDPILNSKPQSLEDLYTYFYDTEKKEWVKLERVEIDQEKCLVKSRTNHFTDMINATLTLPESASPVDVNLNSIKNLEAAKPDSHLIKFNSPQASNSGDAAFSFELQIPGGRRGMQPGLTVSYSSSGENGIMGKGFDVNYGSVITTDTRFGLPDYKLELNPDSKKGRFLLDGVVLKVKKYNNKKTVIEYEPLKEASFEKIVRYDPLTENDRWVVTSKNGTKRYFDRTYDSCVGSDKEIFTWHITKVEDTHGNNIVYKYLKDNEYVYPDKICYTGKGEKEGLYSVKFNYDKEIRKDIRSDARSRKIVTCKWLLTSITTQYADGNPIRTYSFEYEEGLAMEEKLNKFIVASSGKDSYEYSFDYKKPEIETTNGAIKYFDDQMPWTNGKPLRIGRSKSFGFNTSVSAGAGYGWPFVDLRTTGGLFVSAGGSDSYSESMMLDIDGDGSPDYVSYDLINNSIKVCRNKNNEFGKEEKISIKGKKGLELSMNYETSSNSSVGANVYAGVGTGQKVTVKGSLGAGYTRTYQTSNPNSAFSFMDMNNDGLVDILRREKSIT